MDARTFAFVTVAIEGKRKGVSVWKLPPFRIFPHLSNYNMSSYGLQLQTAVQLFTPEQ